MSDSKEIRDLPENRWLVRITGVYVFGFLALAAMLGYCGEKSSQRGLVERMNAPIVQTCISHRVTERVQVIE